MSYPSSYTSFIFFIYESFENIGDWIMILQLIEVKVKGSFVLESNILYSTWAPIVSFLLKSIFNIINSLSPVSISLNLLSHSPKIISDIILFSFISLFILKESVISIVILFPYIGIDLFILFISFFSKILSPRVFISVEIFPSAYCPPPRIFEI